MSTRPLPRILSSRTILRTGLFEIQERLVRFPNGAERRLEILNYVAGSSVLVIPLSGDNLVLLIREYCAGTHSYELALPTGTVKPGESVQDTARRELSEEIGYCARKIDPLATLSVLPGHSDHKTHIVMASELYPATGIGDEPEPLEVVAYPLQDIGQLVTLGQVSEARSALALLLLERQLRGTPAEPIQI